jgi:hypothetical protein
MPACVSIQVKSKLLKNHRQIFIRQMAKASRTGTRAEANSAGEEEATSASSPPSSSREENIARGIEGKMRRPKREETVDDGGLSTMAVVMLMLALVFGCGAVILAQGGLSLRMGLPSRGHERSESRIEPTRYLLTDLYMRIFASVPLCVDFFSGSLVLCAVVRYARTPPTHLMYLPLCLCLMHQTLRFVLSPTFRENAFLFSGFKLHRH